MEKINQSELAADMRNVNSSLIKIIQEKIENLKSKYPFDGIVFTFTEMPSKASPIGVNIDLSKITLENQNGTDN